MRVNVFCLLRALACAFSFVLGPNPAFEAYFKFLTKENKKFLQMEESDKIYAYSDSYQKNFNARLDDLRKKFPEECFEQLLEEHIRSLAEKMNDDDMYETLKHLSNIFFHKIGFLSIGYYIVASDNRFSLWHISENDGFFQHMRFQKSPKTTLRHVIRALYDDRMPDCPRPSAEFDVIVTPMERPPVMRGVTGSHVSLEPTHDLLLLAELFQKDEVLLDCTAFQESVENTSKFLLNLGYRIERSEREDKRIRHFKLTSSF